MNHNPIHFLRFPQGKQEARIMVAPERFAGGSWTPLPTPSRKDLHPCANAVSIRYRTHQLHHHVIQDDRIISQDRMRIPLDTSDHQVLVSIQVKVSANHHR
jgi:hypothetical protein